MIVLDTNLLLRYLLNDDIAQAKRVARLLETSSQITVTPTIVLELVWVLECSDCSRAEIAAALRHVPGLMTVAPDPVESFIVRCRASPRPNWRSRRALSSARALPDLAEPYATTEQDYMFERSISFRHSNGSSSPGRVDCYKRGHFVLEARKVGAGDTANVVIRACCRPKSAPITTFALGRARRLRAIFSASRESRAAATHPRPWLREVPAAARPSSAC